ncbi:aminotransferase class V-fold PLP-dependent enzyme [Paralysiella testudinis]|uniref:Alanine--glyoxylate aminotransferase family protein n=1 Tax=Paralysiella testudinis TaxID=2809020 RepID=A0A892ZIX1_9NEIS|nr:aminotransferase class V-fold PLP-dependent enzyme [Paralysiella testudinis]QRQ81484.1 alanine--glyoxylate aminotransferase family protein [Paralysiella testudinis]
MTALLPHIDPDGLLEYSVVYTDRALNHMSARFQTAMRDISGLLKQVYHADAVAIVPGSGTFAMEAVARQLAQDQSCLVVRNGFFSFRWSQILEMGNISRQVTVMNAQAAAGSQQPFAPAPIEAVCAAIAEQRPAVVFAPHVETASGMMLPDSYIRRLADAVHAVGGLLVIDCIASGTVWLNMQALGIDVLISAPQKGWSGSPCCGMVMLSEAAVARVNDTQSSSFACDLKKWLHIMQAYENGGHAYHATMPTDALLVLRDVMQEAERIGFEALKTAQLQLGQDVRDLLAEYGYASVAAADFAAPGVVVCYTDDADIHSGKAFARHGVQIAAGVPLQVGEPAGFQTFRIGLFGLDKLQNPARTVASLRQALDEIRA